MVCWVETCHLRNHSSNHLITTNNVVGGKGILPKGGQPTLPLETHEILHILRQQATWGQEHATVNKGSYFVSCSTTFFIGFGFNSSTWIPPQLRLSLSP